MKRLLLLLIVLLAGHQGFSQKTLREEVALVEKKIAAAKEDTVKVKMYILQSKKYQEARLFKEAFAASDKALKLALKLKWDKGVVQSYATTSDAYLLNYDTKNARLFLEKALAVSATIDEKSYSARIYKTLGGSYFLEDYKKSLGYYRKALAVFKKLKMYPEYCEVLIQMGKLEETKGNYYEAADCYQKMINAGEEVKCIEFIISGNTYLAAIYTRLENNSKAREYLMNSLDVIKRNTIKDVKYHSTLFEIGNTYANDKKYDKALKYYTDGYKALGTSGDKNYESAYLLTISDAYRSKGDIVTSKVYFNKAVDLARALNDPNVKVQMMRNLGLVAFSNGDYNKAFDFHSEFLDIAQKLPYDYFVSSANGNLGAVMVKLAESKNGSAREALLKEAIGHLKKAMVATDDRVTLEDLQTYSKYLSEAYELQENVTMAYSAYKDYIVYKDSFENNKKRDQFTNDQFKYEYERKENQLKLKQQAELKEGEAVRNYSFAGIGILVIVAGGAGVAYARKRKDNRIIAYEKKRSEDLLLNILPFEVAEELKDKGEADAHYYEKVTILFTDFEGFTKLSEKMKPSEIISELNFCFKAFDAIIEKYNIEKIKTIGDAYMAVSGLPVANPDHAINVVKAALEIRDFILEYKEQKKREGKVYFEMRIGINSGEVVAGIVGVKKFAYDIWGDAVNVAARMETNGVVGKVNISETTYELVKNDIETEYRGEIEVKGKGSIKMYFAEPK